MRSHLVESPPFLELQVHKNVHLVHEFLECHQPGALPTVVGRDHLEKLLCILHEVDLCMCVCVCVCMLVMVGVPLHDTISRTSCAPCMRMCVYVPLQPGVPLENKCVEEFLCTMHSSEL